MHEEFIGEGGRRYVKVVFDVPPDGMVASEGMWCLPLGGGLCRVENAPLFVYDVSAEDVVRAARGPDGRLRFVAVEVARRGAGEDAFVCVLGLGDPGDLPGLYEAGADLVVSDLHERLAAEGRPWADPALVAGGLTELEPLRLALMNLATATGAALPLSAHRTIGQARSLPFVREEGAW